MALVFAAALGACSGDDANPFPIEVTDSRVEAGERIYAGNCASCHGPVNGPTVLESAPVHGDAGHTWHHPDRLLFQWILDQPGIDAVFVGPNDVAFSTLKAGESFTGPAGSSGDGADSWTAFARTPEVLALCDVVLQAAKKRGVPFGMTAGSIGEVREWHAKGAKFMTLGGDFLFMRAGAEQMLR